MFGIKQGLRWKEHQVPFLYFVSDSILINKCMSSFHDLAWMCGCWLHTCDFTTQSRGTDIGEPSGDEGPWMSLIIWVFTRRQYRSKSDFFQKLSQLRWPTDRNMTLCRAQIRFRATTSSCLFWKHQDNEEERFREKRNLRGTWMFPFISGCGGWSLINGWDPLPCELTQQGTCLSKDVCEPQPSPPSSTGVNQGGCLLNVRCDKTALL